MSNSNQEPIPKALDLYLRISQYPILGQLIRQRMREELFDRGVISQEQFHAEVKNKAKLSQQREGAPLGQDPEEVWQERLAQIRDHLTDFYFAYNLPSSALDQILREVLAERASRPEDALPFNPELAPRAFLIAWAKEYNDLPQEQQEQLKHHLEEITVVLIKRMISDQMDFVTRAKQFLQAEDFEHIQGQRIGTGKIGGKAAGMILAWKIIQREDPQDNGDLRGRVAVPDSYFVGTDVFYDFHAFNGLDSFINQKYKSQEEIRADYPGLQETYTQGQFPPEIVDRLRALLAKVGNAPLIVRSSSLLEDNFECSFAGKYDSVFCPNQSTPEQNLTALTHAISRVYASVLNPDALLYRRKMGLLDYDERMAVLIQKVQGQRYRDFFFPALAGVAFSHNPLRWTPRIRPEAGLLRMVWGLGTRAVDRVDTGYPRMVALSHPKLRPEVGADQIRKYSQRSVDLIDLQANQFKTLPVAEMLESDYPALELLASVDKGDYLSSIRAPGTVGDAALVLTFDKFLENRRFVSLMRGVLKKLERHYQRPVDVEFTVQITEDPSGEHRYDFKLHLLQCRPLSRKKWDGNLQIPDDVPSEAVLFRTQRLVPDGRVSRIRYVVYVDPAQYARTTDYETRFELARVVGRLNQRLESENFILMGPGRWGTSNVELGLKVTYADVCNARVLVEIAQSRDNETLEVSYGTHFFQDLVEANIYPLPLYPDAPGSAFNRRFFKRAANVLGELLPADAQYAPFVKVIDVPMETGGRFLDLVMNSRQDEALAYLRPHNVTA